ncbi:MAG: DUF4310 family protein [Erysipelotrichaceae bacterium]
MSENTKITMNNSNGFMNKFNDFLLKDSTFILLIIGAASAIFAGTFLYINFGTGAFNDLAIVQMLKDGLDGGDFTAAAGFAAGFLIARILEGPLVGILDIGGSLMTGVGIGIPALLLSMGVTFPFDNFIFALLVGAGIGLIIGCIIMGIRKFVPDGVAVGGTEIMMGAGNAAGRYLGPMIIITSAQYNPWTGIGSLLGAVVFYLWGKEMTGGAILGAMILGAIVL